MSCAQSQSHRAATARTSARVLKAGVVAGVAELLPKPPPISALPQGEVVDLPGRGRTFVVDVPGPTPYAPTIVLLHGLACTAYLGWAASVESLSRHYRVVTFDQRWHGRGIRSTRFRVADCADDVASVMDLLQVDRALVVGYSMGGAIAQETWRRHPHRVSGLVLGSTAATWRDHVGERIFFPMVAMAMHPMAAYALAKVELRASLLPETPEVAIDDLHRWSAAEFRSTSLWSMPEVLAALGRFDSAALAGRASTCPRAVVVTDRDRAIPRARQLAMAAGIPGATTYHHDGGHASVFLDHARWNPVFLEAVRDVGVRAYGPTLSDSRLRVSG